jgi:hypothetical protein
MQKKSLVTKAQEAAVAEPPGGKATGMTLAVPAAGNGVLSRLMSTPPPSAPYVSAASATPYLFYRKLQKHHLVQERGRG